jgi:CBS domain-containing protein/uncharacterized protein YegL
MKPTVSFDRTVITVVDNDIVHLLVELEAPPAPDSERQPLDVVLVLDKSGSMSGEPLRSVKAATEHFLRLAGPDDRVGVVAFDNTADLVLELATHQFDTAAAQIRNIYTGGSTNLSGGWLKAIEMLEASARPEALRRVIILTDGQANVGETDPDRLASIAASARSRSITTTTIGFGGGYDEKLLATIADAGTGNDYWCAGPDHAPKIFNDEWMKERGFLDENIVTAADLVAKHADKPLVSLYAEELVSHAIAKMRNFGISQIPVMKDGVFVGSIDDSHVYQLLVEDPALRDAPISSIMNAPFPVVNHATHIEDICKLINKQTPAVLVHLENGKYHIVSRYDVISAIS